MADLNGKTPGPFPAPTFPGTLGHKEAPTSQNPDQGRALAPAEPFRRRVQRRSEGHEGGIRTEDVGDFGRWNAAEVGAARRPYLSVGPVFRANPVAAEVTRR